VGLLRNDAAIAARSDIKKTKTQTNKKTATKTLAKASKRLTVQYQIESS
jgi:hypothetical protein